MSINIAMSFAENSDEWYFILTLIESILFMRLWKIFIKRLSFNSKFPLKKTIYTYEIMLIDFQCLMCLDKRLDY